MPDAERGPVFAGQGFAPIYEYGLPVAYGDVHRDLDQLVRVYASAETLARFRNDREYGHEVTYADHRAVSDAARLLLAVAIVTRASLDANPPGDNHPLYDEPLRRPVGTLWPKLDDPEKTVPLGVREACNKVVHALASEALYEEPAERRPPALRPVIALYGKRSGVRWCAELDVYHFAGAVYALFPGQ